MKKVFVMMLLSIALMLLAGGCDSMAKGYPDNFGQSIWLRYGPSNVVAFSTTITAGNAEQVGNVTAKGVMIGFWLKITATDFDSNLVMALFTDETSVSIYQSDDCDDNNYESYQSIIFKPTLRDSVNGEYGFKCNKNITFEDSVYLEFTNNTSANVTIEGELYYQQVTE